MNLFFGLVPLALIVAMIYGYIMNIMYLVGLDNFVFTGKVILSSIGVVVIPLGSIMGLFVN